VREWDTGQYEKMWDSLVSGQSSLVRERSLAACQRDSLQQTGASSVSYTKTVSRARSVITVAGTGRRARTVRVTAELSLAGREPLVRTSTVDWTAEAATWRWVLGSAALNAYRRGGCPR
jgi:hypothetical protein